MTGLQAKALKKRRLPTTPAGKPMPRVQWNRRLSLYWQTRRHQSRYWASRKANRMNYLRRNLPRARRRRLFCRNRLPRN